MLTGDKLETAINIGKSTSIITKNSELIIIDGLDHNEIFLQLNKYYNLVKTLVVEKIFYKIMFYISIFLLFI